MPSELREHQHEITALDGTGGLVFGTEDTGYLTLARPVIEGGDQRLGDRDLSHEDGRGMGRDYRGGKSVVFEIGVLTDHLTAEDVHGGHLAYLDRLESFWDDPKWRDGPGAMAVLRTHEAGATVRAYGRPRRYEEVASKTTIMGFTNVITSFDLKDNGWYADTEQVEDVTLDSGSEGGFSEPLVAPLSLVQPTAGTAILRVGGSRATWPVVEFHGPLGGRPSVTIGDMEIALAYTLGAGEVVVVDPSPWVRAVYRQSDGAGLGGALTGRTPTMKRMKVEPGEHLITLAATDATGTGWARVRWRDARSRPGIQYAVPPYVP